MPQLFAALLVRRFSCTRADVDEAFLALGARPEICTMPLVRGIPIMYQILVLKMNDTQHEHSMLFHWTNLMSIHLTLLLIYNPPDSLTYMCEGLDCKTARCVCMQLCPKHLHRNATNHQNTLQIDVSSFEQSCKIFVPASLTLLLVDRP